LEFNLHASSARGYGRPVLGGAGKSSGSSDTIRHFPFCFSTRQAIVFWRRSTDTRSSLFASCINPFELYGALPGIARVVDQLNRRSNDVAPNQTTYPRLREIEGEVRQLAAYAAYRDRRTAVGVLSPVVAAVANGSASALFHGPGDTISGLMGVK